MSSLQMERINYMCLTYKQVNKKIFIYYFLNVCFVILWCQNQLNSGLEALFRLLRSDILYIEKLYIGYTFHTSSTSIFLDSTRNNEASWSINFFWISGIQLYLDSQEEKVYAAFLG